MTTNLIFKFLHAIFEHREAWVAYYMRSSNSTSTHLHANSQTHLGNKRDWCMSNLRICSQLNQKWRIPHVKLKRIYWAITHESTNFRAKPSMLGIGSRPWLTKNKKAHGYSGFWSYFCGFLSQKSKDNVELSIFLKV